jgi:hypothetical protein
MSESLLYRTLYHDLDGLVVIALCLRVRYAAVALCGGNVRMAEKILDRGDVGIRVQKLCRHGVAQTVTGDLYFAFAGIVFDPLLDAPNGERCAGPWSFLHEEDPPGFRAPRGEVRSAARASLLT